MLGAGLVTLNVDTAHPVTNTLAGDTRYEKQIGLMCNPVLDPDFRTVSAQDSKQSGKPPAAGREKVAAKGANAAPQKTAAAAGEARAEVKAQQTPAAPDERNADRAAVRGVMESFATAFAARMRGRSQRTGLSKVSIGTPTV